MWKICFSTEGCVAYARRYEAKALRAISAFCCAYNVKSVIAIWNKSYHIPLSSADTTAQMLIELQLRDPHTLCLARQNPPVECVQQRQLRSGPHHLQWPH